jgi:hypothetical protein
VQGPCPSPEVAWSSTAPLCKHTPGSGLPSRFGTPRLADLHPVPVMTTRRLATTLPPSSRPHTGIFVSYQCREKRCGSSPVPTPETIATRSGLLYAGWSGANACQRSDLTGPPPSHVGSGVSQPLSPRRPHDASDRGFLRPHRSQDSSGHPHVARSSRPFLHRLQTLGVANP